MCIFSHIVLFYYKNRKCLLYLEIDLYFMYGIWNIFVKYILMFTYAFQHIHIFIMEYLIHTHEHFGKYMCV